jgi:hypothetical protein
VQYDSLLPVKNHHGIDVQVAGSSRDGSDHRYDCKGGEDLEATGVVLINQRKILGRRADAKGV